MVGTGTAAGMGFTVSFLIASLAFSGTALSYAKLGPHRAGRRRALGYVTVFSVIAALPPPAADPAAVRRQESITDLIVGDPVSTRNGTASGVRRETPLAAGPLVK